MSNTNQINTENELLTLHNYIKELEGMVVTSESYIKELKEQNLKLTRSNATFKANATRRKKQKATSNA